jgi:hypothetical protein
VRVIVGIAAIVIGAGTAAIIAGSSQWREATAAAVAELAPSPTPARILYLHESTSGLPAPVARYFRTVLTDGQATVRSATATQAAEFFINGAWRPLRATQHFTVTPPGFVWDAEIGLAPLLAASVRDAYVNGRGAMQASLFGVYSLADQVDQPPLNAGALQRFLGEAIWFPTALLPSTAVTWTPRDDRSAIVTLRDGASTVSLVFEFNAEGQVARITGDRFKEGGGSYTVQPWQIECDEHARRDGMVIPLRCEVAWITNGRPEPYWRGRITAITYRYN